MRYFQNTFVSQGTFMIGEAILINNSMPLKKKIISALIKTGPILHPFHSKAPE